MQDKQKLQKEFNEIQSEIDNYTENELLDSYKILTGLDIEDIELEDIKQYLKNYWKEQIYKDENIKVN